MNRFPYTNGHLLISPLGHLEDLRPEGGARLPALLRHVARHAHRRSILLLISDLLEPAESILDELRELVFLEHECLVFHVLDRDEVEFPFERSAVFEDLETGVRRRVAPQTARKKYLERFQAFMKAHREMFRAVEMPYRLVRTDDDPWRGLGEFLAGRNT
jgi:hypothetical protein